jgi:putative DNA primase/helicase
MVMPKGTAEAVALWVLHAHAHDCAAISPILGITSPSAECGKTTLLTILSALVPRALHAANITPSVLFRVIEKYRPTLLVDEADTFLGDNSELRGVLNCGHQKSSATILRNVGDDHEPKVFRTWAPKAIAQIKAMPATLTSRAIRIDLQRKSPGHNVKPLRADRLDHLMPLARQAARWVADNQIWLVALDPDMPVEIGNRTADNWRPLIAIADAAGGEWPERARLIAIGDRMPVQELGIMLLEDIKKIFEEDRVDRIASKELANKLLLFEERPWVEYRHGKPITPRQIAELLESFKIVPNTIRLGTTTAKGYLSNQFVEVFASYTPVPAVTTSQASKTTKNEAKINVTADGVLRRENDEKTRSSGSCDGVTDKKGGKAESAHAQPPEPSRLNGHRVCVHCHQGDSAKDRLIFALIPGINHHGHIHKACRQQLTSQGKSS